MASIRLFESAKQAVEYSRFRFSYPIELTNTIKEFANNEVGIGTQAMIDIACGSGQSTMPWCGVFDKCLGVDISEAQIKCAQEKLSSATCNATSCTNSNNKVEFSVSSSDRLPLSDDSVDMVTCGQAWHWLDHSTTIPEIKRVVRSPGCIAIYGYGNIELVNTSADRLVRQFYSVTLKGFWHPNRRHIDEMYKSLPMVYPTQVYRVFPVRKLASFADFFGYINTWSGYIEYNKMNPSTDALKILEEELRRVINCDEIEFTIPYFLYLSKKF